MKIWTKILSFNLLLLIGLNASAVITDDAIYRKMNIPQLDQPTVMGYLNQFNKSIVGDKDGKPIPAIFFLVYTNKIKSWMTSPFLEVDTDIDRSWFEKIYTMMDYMAKAKDFIDLAKLNRKQNTKEYKEAVANFTLAFQRFNDLLKHPTEVPAKKMEKLRKEKNDWLKKTREKLEKQNK